MFGRSKVTVDDYNAIEKFIKKHVNNMVAEATKHCRATTLRDYRLEVVRIAAILASTPLFEDECGWLVDPEAWTTRDDKVGYLVLHAKAFLSAAGIDEPEEWTGEGRCPHNYDIGAGPFCPTCPRPKPEVPNDSA